MRDREPGDRGPDLGRHVGVAVGGSAGGKTIDARDQQRRLEAATFIGGIELREGFGMTETTGFATAVMPGQVRLGSAGTRAPKGVACGGTGTRRNSSASGEAATVSTRRWHKQRGPATRSR